MAVNQFSPYEKRMMVKSLISPSALVRVMMRHEEYVIEQKEGKYLLYNSMKLFFPMVEDLVT